MAMICPKCHSVVKKEWAICPVCGLPHASPLRRMRCGVCGQVNLGIHQVCSACGADLATRPFAFLLGKGKYVRRASIALLVAGVVTGVVTIRLDVERQADQVAAFFMPTPTPTHTATGTPTATYTHTPMPTVTPTATPSPTSTATSTDTPVPTATRTVVLSRTATPTRTPRATPTPRFRTPTLIGPPNGEIFIGENQYVVLRWESAGVLGADEWYAVRLSWSENGALAQRGGNNVKETAWQVPADLFYHKADQDTGRAYRWNVYVERVTQSEEGQRVGEPLSSVSDTRTFYWQ
jgi:hypothetical protein